MPLIFCQKFHHVRGLHKNGCGLMQGPPGPSGLGPQSPLNNPVLMLFLKVVLIPLCEGKHIFDEHKYINQNLFLCP